VRVELEAKDRLCRLFEFDVGDLFDFVPEKKSAKDRGGS
jgi:DNA-binding Xre family transcriptional regulator